jgi:hypothetical protein
MDQMILCATTMAALRWWARVAFHPTDWRQGSNRVYTLVSTEIAEPHEAAHHGRSK